MSARHGALALVAAVFGLAAGASGQSPDLATGERVFRDNCAVCHGAAGDGQGMAAHHFKTPPRDLAKGRFKFRSTASGQVPTDADLARTIVQGIPSTGMVPQGRSCWRIWSSPTKSWMTAFSAFTPRQGQEEACVKGECAECHGKEARGDGPSAKDLSVKPSDLTRRPLKSGATARDIMRTLLTGLDGTPMPSYYQVLEDDELWDLAYWLAARGGSPETTDDERAGWHVVQMHQRRGR